MWQCTAAISELWIERQSRRMQTQNQLGTHTQSQKANEHIKGDSRKCINSLFLWCHLSIYEHRACFVFSILLGHSGRVKFFLIYILSITKFILSVYHPDFSCTWIHYSYFL